MLCVLFFCVFLWEKEHCRCVWIGFSLTEHTERTEPFGARFEPTEGLRHTEFTEAFQLRLAVTLCDIGWLNVSVECCVFCSSVFFCEKKKTLESRGEIFLSQSTQSEQSVIAHSFESTERLRHTEFTERYCYRWRDVCERGKLIK